MSSPDERRVQLSIHQAHHLEHDGDSHAANARDSDAQPVQIWGGSTAGVGRTWGCARGAPARRKPDECPESWERGGQDQKQQVLSKRGSLRQQAWNRQPRGLILQLGSFPALIFHHNVFRVASDCECQGSETGLILVDSFGVLTT